MASLTPNSSSTSYLSVTEFLKRADSNLVGQLVSDDGTQVTATNLQTNANLLAILSDVSAIFESAALVGGRYNPSDLNTLVSSNTVGASLILRILSDLAIGLLRQRRGMNEDSPYSGFVQASAFLDSLRKGETILPFLETQEAGQADDTYMTLSDYFKQGRLTAVYPRFFGTNRPDQVDYYTTSL